MAPESLRLQPGTLWARLLARTDYALRRGALQSIPTACEWVEQNGIPFIVRVLTSLACKDQAGRDRTCKAASGTEFNPFLPYDEDLFVADISDTHLCLLNKFNVLDHHLLIVTRAFENQERLLNLQDFEALWICMLEFEGLAFYNSGRIAGASQRHKHLQLVPLPLALPGPRIPIEPALAAARFTEAVGTVPYLPFVHTVVRLESRWLQSPREAAVATLELYHRMLHAVGLQGDAAAGDNRQRGPYNLLATRQWMLLVPRSQECFASISVNALGFAGALLVRNEQQAQVVREQGPLTILQQVAVPLEVDRSPEGA
jgi:ATP adenylyltransferase